MNWEATLRILQTIFGCALVIVAAISWVWGHLVRPRQVLMKWAEQNDFVIVTFQRALFGGGFGLLSSAPLQIVYSVTIRTDKGIERLGWVRCGSLAGGAMFSDKTEVLWLL